MLVGANIENRWFQRIIIVGKSPKKLGELPTRDAETLVIMPDRRLPWADHFMESGSILVVLDELLDPSAAALAEHRAQQVCEFPGSGSVRFVFNPYYEKNNSLRWEIMNDDSILTYKRTGSGDLNGFSRTPTSLTLDPMSDLSFLSDVIDVFAAPMATVHFCHFGEEIDQMEKSDSGRSGQFMTDLVRRQYRVAFTETPFDPESLFTPTKSCSDAVDQEEGKVSIVIPLYNGAPFINRTLQSIVDQDYDNIEVIVVNDGSTDGSAELAKTFAKKIKAFTLIDQQNQGVAEARNVGLDAAVGMYVTFLDADDVLLPESIRRRVRFLESTRFRICGGLTEVIDDDDRSLNLTLGRQADCAYEDLWEMMFHISTVMGQAEVMKAQRFLDRRRCPEDWRYLLDLVSTGDRIGLCGVEPLTRYRWHNSSATQMDTMGNFDICINMMKDLPIKPREELGMSIAYGASIGVNGEKLKESYVSRVQSLCLTLAILPEEQSIPERVLDLMNRIEVSSADGVPSLFFENTLTRALLLPRQSSVLYHSILERAPDALCKLSALAKTPANKTFIGAFQDYLLDLRDEVDKAWMRAPNF